MPTIEPFSDHDQTCAAQLTRCMGLFALCLVGSTWRMWLCWSPVPRIPAWGGLLRAPLWFDQVATVSMLLGLAGAVVLANLPRWRTRMLLVFVASALLLVLLDQQRFQPWLLQMGIVACVLAWARPNVALIWLRAFIVSFYFHSALTKCDYAFPHTIGQQFLDALLGIVGLSTASWSANARLAAAALFPALEMLIALGLALPRTRRVALVGAVLLHLTLLLILGPWGLGHRPGVLLWNAYFIAQDLLLFAGWQGVAMSWRARWSEALAAPWRVRVLVAGAALLPFLEPTTWYDLWPSWGLYAGSAQHVTLLVHREALATLEPSLQPFVEAPADPADPWSEVHLDRWVLASVSAPLYPQNRVQLGMAEAVVARAQLGPRARVVRASAAQRWTGQRSYDVLVGLPQISEAAADYFFNARPRQAAWNPD